MPAINLIAFVDPSGLIRTVHPDGSSINRIGPDEGFFTWPIWSPDATQIVFSGVAPGKEGRGPLAMFVYLLGEDRTEIVYANEPGMGPILRGMPHYPLWAPDGSRLSFMASVPQGLTLFIDERPAEDGVGVVLRKAPLYAAWSADSRYLLVHGGLDHFLVDVGHRVKVEDLDIQSANYRVASWWPSGNKITYVSEHGAGEDGLYLADVESGDRTLVAEVPGGVAFLWSPDGESLALAHSVRRGGLLYQGVRFYSPDGTTQPLSINERLFAFFWSPDGTKLAYVTPSQQRGVLRWMVLDVTDGRRWPLVDFVPSRDQMTIFQFFDQFAYSHSLWSPDSRSLVFAGAPADGAVSASFNRQTASQIIVLDTDAASSPSPIAEGFLAVWSPR